MCFKENPPEDVADWFVDEGYRTHERIREASNFEVGDHVTLARWVVWKYPVYTHHAIVTHTHQDEGKITVIHFKPQGRFYSKRKAIILQEQLVVAKERLFKIKYHADEVLPPDEVVRRAVDMLGEQSYNLCSHNCEHMATECKTGRACSGQVQKVVMTATTVAAQRLIKLGITLLCEAIETGIVASLKALSSGRVLAAVKVTGRIGIIGVIIGSIVESIFIGYEAWKQKKRQGNGEISQRDFEDIMTKRVTEGLFDIGGGVGGMCAGAAVGALVGPVGALVGGIIGAIIGGLAGRGVGFLMGKFFVKLRQEFEVFYKKDVPGILSGDDTPEDQLIVEEGQASVEYSDILCL